MTDEMKKELKEIEAEADKIAEYDKFNWHVLAAAGIAYIAAMALIVFKDAQPFVIALPAALHFTWIYRTIAVAQRRYNARKRWYAWKKQKAMPLYHDLLEKMSDKYHVHLENTGMITITSHEDMKKLNSNLEK